MFAATKNMLAGVVCLGALVGFSASLPTGNASHGRELTDTDNEVQASPSIAIGSKSSKSQKEEGASVKSKSTKKSANSKSTKKSTNSTKSTKKKSGKSASKTSKKSTPPPSTSSTTSPSNAPTAVTDLFSYVGPGVCLDASGMDYDYVEINSAAAGVTDMAQCIDKCAGLIPGADVTKLAGVVVEGQGSIVTWDICRCQFTDGVLPSADLFPNQSSGAFTCPSFANRCYGLYATTGPVTQSVTQTPVGVCYKNDAYSPYPSASPTISPTTVGNLFSYVGPGVCLDASGMDYDYVEINSAAAGVTDMAQCIGRCAGLIPGADVTKLAGVVVEGPGSIATWDICRCQFTDGVLPSADLFPNESSGAFTCPSSFANRCYGLYTTTGPVAQSVTQTPVGACYKNDVYSP